MMKRRPNLNGSVGPRSTGVPLLHPSNRVLLEREGISQAPVIASSFRSSALPSLQVLPWDPPPDDLWPKRPTAAHRERSWFNSSSNSLVPALPNQPPAQTNRRRRNKDLSFTEVLKKYKLLPDSQPSSPESLNQPEMRRARSPVSITRPEWRPCNPLRPTRRPVSPVGLVQSGVQPTRPEGRPSNPRRTTRRKVRPSNSVPPIMPESHPTCPAVSLVQPESRPTCPEVSLVQPESCPTCPAVSLVQPESHPTCPAVSLVQPECRPTCPLTLKELALPEPCSFSNNVFVLSMPEAAQPEEAARRTTSPPRDITRTEAFVRTGPLLARRARRDAPPPKMVPKPPVAPRPKLLPSLGQGNVSLVSANTWDESTKKKGKKGVRVQRSSMGLRHIPRDLELAMMRPSLFKSAVPSQRPYQPWDDEDEVDIYALRRTAYMCPMYDQEERSGRGNKRVAVEALDNIPFRRKITLCYLNGGRRFMLPQDY